MATLVLTILGTDRAGLVSTVSRAISARGGSWKRSQLAHLGDTFAGVVEVDVSAAEADGLVADIEALSAQGLRVEVERSSADASTTPAGRHLTLHLIGADRPGILAEVSSLLAAHHVNVEELETDLVEAPMAGGTLFEATVRIGLALDADVEALRAALEDLANELMVDVDLDSVEEG